MCPTLCRLKGLRWSIVILTLACVSKSKSPEPVPAENFCQAFAKAACSWEQRCSPTTKPEECEKHYGAPCERQLPFRVLTAIRYDEISYDPQLAATWLNSLSQLPCEPDEVILAPEFLFRESAREEEF